MVTVEILGHKAKVEKVIGQAKDDFLQKDDQLVVWIEFDEPVGGTAAFPIYLPAKKYADRAEFLYNVRLRGEEGLERILAKDEEDRREMQERNERKAALDAVAAEAQSLLE